MRRTRIRHSRVYKQQHLSPIACVSAQTLGLPGFISCHLHSQSRQYACLHHLSQPPWLVLQLYLPSRCEVVVAVFEGWPPQCHEVVSAAKTCFGIHSRRYRQGFADKPVRGCRQIHLTLAASFSHISWWMTLDSACSLHKMEASMYVFVFMQTLFARIERRNSLSSSCVTNLRVIATLKRFQCSQRVQISLLAERVMSVGVNLFEI
eukprot:3268635-Amphidinium_carterae.1